MLTMANHKSRRRQHKNSYYEDSSEPESADSAGSDWMQDQRKRTRKLWKQSQGLAAEPGESRRNLKVAERKVAKKTGLGKGEAKGKEDGLRQCYWLDCVNAARRASKYCSDECGEKLARLRILQILPERISAWQSTPNEAEERNKEQLLEIKAKVIKFRSQFEELEEKRQALDKYIEAVSKLSHDSTVDLKEAGLGDDGATVACVMCGHETNTRGYLKHIERCFIRTEKNIAFVSKMVSYLPGTRLFCDTLDKKTGLYCKRLAVTCPDHSKKPHVAKNTICGAPLSKDTLNLDNICSALKSKCQRHYNWEKYRQAEIDIQKVEAWTKQEQMLTKEQDITRQMSDRAGLLNLLLNSTKAG